LIRHLVSIWRTNAAYSTSTTRNDMLIIYFITCLEKGWDIW